MFAILASGVYKEKVDGQPFIISTRQTGRGLGAMRIGPSLETVNRRQYERQAANHGRAVTEAMVEIGLAAAFLIGGDLLDGKIDFTFGKVWALFTPLLPVMIFLVPFFAVSLTQPIRDLREAAEQANRRLLVHGPSLGRLLLLAFVTVFALLPLIKQYEVKLFAMIGVEFRLPDLPFQYGASVGRYVITLLLVAWVTSKIAHHMAVTGSDIPTNENDRVMLATYGLIARAFRGFIRFCRWMRRKARERKERQRDPVITDARKGRRPQGDPRPATVRPYSGSFTDDDFTTRELPPLGGVGHGHSPRAHEPSVVAYGGSGHRSESSGHGDSAHYPDSPVYSGSLLDSLGEPTSATTD